jgi:hypothetical protein
MKLEAEMPTDCKQANSRAAVTTEREGLASARMRQSGLAGNEPQETEPKSPVRRSFVGYGRANDRSSSNSLDYKITQGVPAAIVRSYKQPLYDSEVILAATPSREFTLYQKPVGQSMNDGTVKTFLYSNQSQAGSLGTPLSFDIYGFNARVWASPSSKIMTIGNYTLVEAAGVAQVIFGQDTTFLTVPIEDVPSGVDTEGMGATDAPHVGWGTGDNMYRFDIGSRALHINSTEPYSVKISWPSGLSGTTGNLLFRWLGRGARATRSRKAA